MVADFLWHLRVVGSRWRVGNGQTTRTWSDRWLPRLFTFKPLIRPLNTSDGDRVSSLLDGSDGRWNEADVRNLFHPSGAELVLGYSAGRSQNEEMNGIFISRKEYGRVEESEKLTRAVFSIAATKLAPVVIIFIDEVDSLLDLPDAGTRLEILKVLLAQENLESGFPFEQLAYATKGYSGSDLKNLSVAAAYRSVQELLTTKSRKRG
ncbi:hypothetical protein Salat_1482400 [Sesamum alatum]|uniref:ATPase AAA-type core domain-containing protein n=1 Tax=Sesamum alatum TaxID=300844 RepID=A0AAE1YBF3_9LAMI|nr:hypothetical protein Salat_1482400 [Sesamum alatum]